VRKLLRHTIRLAFILLLSVGCGAPTAVPTSVSPAVGAPPAPVSPTATPLLPVDPSPTPADDGRTDGLSEQEAATLGSLEQVDDYPLYTMRYYGSYRAAAVPVDAVEGATGPSTPHPGEGEPLSAWACSLLAALGDAEGRLYGRNFDWRFSPAVLLFADPPDGYASVSMVDIAYLFDPTEARRLIELPLAERRALLRAPFMPFDGMNEHGLAVGMAAVLGSEMPHDANKETVDSLRVIREMLDRARNVDEAVQILGSYNVSWAGGPPLHYLIADASGRAALVEFYDGKLVVIPNEEAWHLATNFLQVTADETGGWPCWRYDEIHRQLTETGGRVAAQDAMDLLGQVSQEMTQWSVLYGMSTGQVDVVMGRQYEDVHTFQLKRAAD